ncbi:hypothetical protein PP175_03030 [Aneurinibacillus sp. Ricciae_BoGa-3]|uniref:hypothetical protein n=1 Tax=Aneurinibacillus sp. Ricciae_BoGa-3 TaxID=3022697 RepID=UPI00233FD68C|nr:hypothetical protein [Aneurinibacillus sp. Ricciae_BoGa-3]WCK54989.1 hypothetical protein PP175_03030 [Aneurinibacillus sp. Ricciae_BoGa-3]
MAKKKSNKRRPVPPATLIKLGQIENSILNLESSLQQTLDRLDALQHISDDIEIIKQNTTRKKREKKGLFFHLKGREDADKESRTERREKRRKRDVAEPIEESNDVSSLLQSPKVKSLLNNSGSGTDLSSLLEKIDLSKLGKLLLQEEQPKKPIKAGPKNSMMPPVKKKAASVPEDKEADLGLDLGNIMELMQNPMIQSMIKKVL